MMVFAGGILASSIETVHCGAMITDTAARFMYTLAYAQHILLAQGTFF